MVDVSAGFELALGSKLDTLNGHLQRSAEDRQQAHITLVNPQRELIAAGATPVFADLGGPQDSFVWDVRRVTIAGLPGAAIPTLGTSCYICKGQALPGLQYVVDVVPVMPSAATYSSGEFVLRSPQNLIVVWTGGTGTLFVDVEAGERPRVTRLLSVI